MHSHPFLFRSEHDEIRETVRGILNSPRAREEREQVSAEQGAPHVPIATYQMLGGAGLLAPDWPATYGGRDSDLISSAIVAEELALAGFPDSPRVNTVENAGAAVLRFGTPAQRDHYLPGFASGESLCSILFSEPEAGSDLGSLDTNALYADGQWRLRGVKAWNAGAPHARTGLCLARCYSGSSKYAGLSLFLVPLKHPKVTITDTSGLNPEPLYTITLDDVDLAPEALLGQVGNGWSILNTALTLERTGICFSARARRWLSVVTEMTRDFGVLQHHRAQLRNLRAEIEAARSLAWRSVWLLQQGENAETQAAAAKWLNSTLACQVAELGWRWRTDSMATPAHGGDREVARMLREAPGLRLAAGTSEMMLSTVASGLLDAGVEAA